MLKKIIKSVNENALYERALGDLLLFASDKNHTFIEYDNLLLVSPLYREIEKLHKIIEQNEKPKRKNH